VVVDCPKKIVLDHIVGNPSNEKFVHLSDLAIVFVLGAWFILDADRIPNV
jgi:hypothetical protein